jgi:hypothetical protein
MFDILLLRRTMFDSRFLIAIADLLASANKHAAM